MAGEAAAKREHAENAEEETTVKRQRTEEESVAEMTTEQSAKIQKVLDSVAQVDEELEKLNDEMNKEILQVETKFNKVKRPAYEKRDKLFLEIPGFWKQALVNHPIVGQEITEEDEKILEYLKALDVTFTDDNGSFKIHLTLSENPYLTSTSLWKQIKYSEDDETEPEVTAAELKWTKLDETKEVSENAKFFAWFASTEGQQSDAEFIKDDLYKTPVQFFLADDEDDDSNGEDDDEEGEEEDDDEEGEEEEEEVVNDE